MKKRILSLLLALCFVLTGALPVFAADNKKTVTVSYTEDHITKGGEVTWDFTYSDAYFKKSSYPYDHDLAKMSLGLCLSASSSRNATNAREYETENRNFLSLMKQIGFKNPESNEWMKKVPVYDSIGINVAQKKLDKHTTLLAVAIRGDLYRAEWGGNLEVGAEGEHKNWAHARDMVLEFVKQYIEDQDITGDIKIWTSGYSRGGATANMVGAALDKMDTLGNGTKLTPENVYCYTYEAPKGGQKDLAQDKVYDNIHNLISENDLVPTLVPADWGFCRYGVDHLYPTKGNSGSEYKKYSDLQWKQLKQTPNELLNLYFPDFYTPYGKDKATVNGKTTWVDVGKTPKELNKTLGTALCTVYFSDRQEFVDSDAEQHFIAALADLQGRGDKDSDIAHALRLFAQKLQDNASTLWGLRNGSSENLADALTGYFIEALKEEGFISYNYEQVKALMSDAAPRLQKMVAAYPGSTLTLLMNLVNIIAAHDIAPNLAWLEVLDEDYLASHTAYSWQECP